MSSESEAFAWIWLPGATEPVVAGKLTAEDGNYVFNYGRSYLGRADAIPLFEPELPLRRGIQRPLPGLTMPGCIRDASPDAWGRRVIVNRKLGAGGGDIDAARLDELTYLLESGSDRAGALDFQRSATMYEARHAGGAALEELLEAAERVEKGIPLSPELDRALNHGTSIGGARPKALIEDEGRKYIAKFSSSSDLYNIVKAEFVAMRLAALCGLNVAQVTLTRASGKDVLLIERFDRECRHGGWTRRAMVSALTLLELDEMMARYASYQDLAEIVRHRFTNASWTLAELFGRIVFNVLSGNTDDHARNHAAFWDGEMLSLTPAYDICPQHRSGNEASQAMLIHGGDRMSRLSTCLDAAHVFLLSEEEARAIVGNQIEGIGSHWLQVCDEAGLNQTDRRLIWGRQFLNPYAFEGLENDRADILERARHIRGRT